MIMTTMMKLITSTSPSQGELFPAFDFHGRAPPLQLWKVGDYDHLDYDDGGDDGDDDDDDDDDDGGGEVVQGLIILGDDGDTCECLGKAVHVLHNFSNALSHPPAGDDDEYKL